MPGGGGSEGEGVPDDKRRCALVDQEREPVFVVGGADSGIGIEACHAALYAEEGMSGV